MAPFSYHYISKGFIGDPSGDDADGGGVNLAQRIADGDGVVLLGPRYGGKRYVMSRLFGLIARSERGPCVRVRLLDDERLSTAERVGAAVRRAVIRSQAKGAAPPPEPAPGDDLLSSLDSLSAAHPHKPVFLFATNVDGMSHHLARRFLQEVRTQYEVKRIVPVLSGEDDFRELVHGPNSEFSCANQYVIQGYVEDEFRTFLDHYLKYLRLKLEAPDEAARHMFELTGSNLYVLRIILWAIIHDRARRDVSPSKPVAVADIPSEVKLTGIPGAYGEHIFRHAVQLISREPKSWEELARLIDGLALPVTPSDVPTRLELAGIAVREEADGDARLHFSSPVMKSFIRRHYDVRRFGDLYASVGRWDEAFGYYSRIEPEDRVRPSGTDDRADVEATVTALCSSFYSEVAGSDEEGADAGGGPKPESAIKLVKERFAKGCHYVLGFSEVTFWHRDVLQATGGWDYDPPATSPLGAAELDQITRILSAEPNRHGHLIKPEDQFRRVAAGALLPVHLNKQEAVVVSNFSNEIAISQERERLVSRLLKEFIRAYRHAVDIDNYRLRQRLREKQVNLASRIFDELGTYGLNVKTLLEKAAAELRRSEFRRRVMFCLVDEERQHITFEVNDSEEEPPPVLTESDWPLSNPTADIQPAVVDSKKPKIVSDARAPRHLANQEVVKAARIKAFAVVPMLNPADKVIGTIHVEHEGGRAPTNGEVLDLLALGRQLAIAVEQCKRVNMLESVIDNIHEAMMLVDAKERALYLNDTAADHFNVPRGLARARGYPRMLDNLPPEIVEPLRECLATENRRATYVAGREDDPNYRGEVIADIIKDWKGRKVGALLRVEDRTYLVRYFENAHLPVGARNTREAIELMLKATRVLGHEWGRMYIVHEVEGDGREFVSYLSYGGRMSPEAVRAFGNKEVSLGRESADNWDWLCVSKKRPVVFCWKEERERGWEYVTPHGVRVLNWPCPEQPPELEKQPGDFWMDFPLIHEGKVLGKMCLHFDEGLRQNDLALLNTLSSRFAEILFASQEREHEKKMIEVNTAEQMMSTMAHNLHTRLAGLPLLLARYHAREKTCPGLQTLNAELGEIYDDIRTTAKRANEMLSPARPRFETVEIGQLVTKILGRHLNEGEWEFNCEECPLEVQLDPYNFATALIELIKNSHEAALPGSSLLVSVTAETVRYAGVEHLLLTFCDNGPGVPPGDGEKIFENFFSRHREKTGGTGLGLGFVRRVIEAHGGHVAYNSSREDGHRGADFRIQIPRSAEVGPEKEENNGSSTNR
ncbi:MAG: ATP-binding protein [Pyrinomonadaceae bacterium]